MAEPTAGSSTLARPKPIWLDCDPGHDDAIALLVALYAPALGQEHGNSPPGFELLGVSTVGGNSSVRHSFVNAARLLTFFKLPVATRDDVATPRLAIDLFVGCEDPLIKPPRHDAGIHGDDGLGLDQSWLRDGGGLPSHEDSEVQARIRKSFCPQLPDVEGLISVDDLPPASPGALLLHWSRLLSGRIEAGLPKMTLVATGPLTNVALLLKSFPDLVAKGIDQIVIMGGAAHGMAGNRGPLAEFNILVDPEAAEIVFQHDIKVVMAGLNVTHQAIFNQDERTRLMVAESMSERGDPNEEGTVEEDRRIQRGFRNTLMSILTFFSKTYDTEFGFKDGPPVHDMLAVLYVLDPTLFYLQDETHSRSMPPKRYRVDVECNAGSLALGATVVDVYDDHKSTEDEHYWGKGSKNVVVLEQVDVKRVWRIFNDCVDRAERAVVEASHSGRG